jgi:protein ImuB
MQNPQDPLGLEPFAEQQAEQEQHAQQPARPQRQAKNRLWAAFVFPRFALETLVQGVAEQACDVVVNGTGSAPRIVAASASAEAAGVSTGMSLSAALAVVPELRAQPRQIAREQEALLTLAAWAGQFTSLACPKYADPPVLLLELGASQRLFGDPQLLAGRIVDGLAELGFAAQWSLAPTPTAAILLARSGRTARVNCVADIRSALDVVPVQCLDLEPHAVAALLGVGVRYLADCWALPRAETARRIGPKLWEQIDCALGVRADPRKPYRIPARIRHRLNLPSPVIGIEAMLFALGRLLRQIEGVLIARGSAVQVLELELGLSGGGSTRVAVELIAPSRDTKHLLSLLRHRLEAIQLSDPVEQVLLEATQCVSLAPRNLDLFDNRVAQEDEWAATLERLNARLGVSGVHGIELQAEHRPEHAWRPVAPSTARQDSKTRQLMSTQMFGQHRPLWLLSEPCHLELRDGLPCYGGPLQLQTSAERIEGGWWEGRDVSRDYHVAVNAAGERYWIYRDRRQRSWYLHGVFS